MRRFYEGFFNYEAGEPSESPLNGGEPSVASGPGPSPAVASPGPSPAVASPGPSPAVASTGPSPAVAIPGLRTQMSNLVDRISQEMLSLNDLADSSTNPTIIAKTNQLGSLQDQLKEYLRQLATNPPQISEEDIPLTTEQINAFLATLGKPAGGTGGYPDLFTPPGNVGTDEEKKQGNGGSSSSSGSMLNETEQLQAIFDNLQNVKWRFEMSVDPVLSQKTNLLDRLESLEKRIMSYAQAGTPIPDNVKKILTHELELITSIIKNAKSIHDTGANTYKERPKTYHTRSGADATTSYRGSEDGRVYYQPYHAGAIGANASRTSYSLFDGVPEDSPDVRIRPGFVMTEEQIRHRGSAAAFNTQAVGGADYKKRAEELCRQIRGAGIGSPADFGCIENDGEVSANYSWKGNYAMVCNRLGDTWGSFYPAMFGCPKYNPDDQYNGNLL